VDNTVNKSGFLLQPLEMKRESLPACKIGSHPSLGKCRLKTHLAAERGVQRHRDLRNGPWADLAGQAGESPGRLGLAPGQDLSARETLTDAAKLPTESVDNIVNKSHFKMQLLEDNRKNRGASKTGSG
jgi:hypothetical protein